MEQEMRQALNYLRWTRELVEQEYGGSFRALLGAEREYWLEASGC